MRKMARDITAEQVQNDAFMKGLFDGQHGKAYDPSHNYQSQEKLDYRAGFDKAREQPRI